MKNRFKMFTKRAALVFSLGLAAMTLTADNLKRTQTTTCISTSLVAAHQRVFQQPKKRVLP